jgi:predicted  nucleic acid-binding Zn-ribbon protein
MAAANQGLRTLHEVHQRLREVEDDLARGPRQIQFRQSQFDKKTAELEARRQRLKQSKLTADQKNLQLKTNESKLADLRAKLNQAGTNREYEILTGQINADTMANSVLEDEILEALTAIDQLQVEVKQAEQEVATADRDLKNAVADAAAREPGLKEREASIRAELKVAEKVLPEDIILQYRRAVQAFGSEALAAVENGVCGACYVQLTQQRTVELRSGKIMFCNCGRLMFIP